MTTSSRYLAVIVYILSKMKKGWKELQTVVQAKSDNNTEKGVLTINLHNYGRGGNTN